MVDETKDGSGGLPRYAARDLIPLGTHPMCGGRGPEYRRVCHSSDVTMLEADLAKVTEERDEARDGVLQLDRLNEGLGTALVEERKENASLRAQVEELEAQAARRHAPPQKPVKGDCIVCFADDVQVTGGVCGSCGSWSY